MVIQWLTFHSSANGVLDGVQYLRLYSIRVALASVVGMPPANLLITHTGAAHARGVLGAWPGFRSRDETSCRKALKCMEFQ